MPAICPTNSTECLLRALVDANSGYDWNPLNFGFTAALSVLGFVVAVFALLQALLAAGPGRLKASSSAVGETYSSQTHTRFDRVELRFRTVAQVPLINMSELAPESNSSSTALHSTQRFSLPGIVSKIFPGKDVRRSGAGWYRLLQDLDMETYPFKTMDCETDYLPDDVKAAPAYATINDIVLLAMLAGCHTLTETNEGPRARGRNIQLDFREHPSLGVVAFYQHYGTPAKVSFDQQQLRSVMQSAMGRLNYRKERLSMAGRIQDSETYFDLDPNRLMTIVESQRKDCEHPGCASRKDVVSSWKDFLVPNDSSGSNHHEAIRITALLFADKLTGLGLYPSKAVDFHSSLAVQRGVNESADEDDLKILLAIHGGELKLVHAGSVSRTQKLSPWKASDSSSWFTPTTKTTQYVGRNAYEGNGQPLLMSTAQHRQVLPDASNIKSTDLVLSYKAMSHCEAWMSDPSYFEGYKPEDREIVRDWLDFQLCEVDYWLSHHGGEDALCAALNIIKNAVLEQVEYVTYESTNRIAETALVFERGTRLRARVEEKETLEYYDLPWSPDPQDGRYITVDQYVDDEMMKNIRDRIKLLREQRRAGGKGGDSATQDPSSGTNASERFPSQDPSETGGSDDPGDVQVERDPATTWDPEEPADPADPEEPTPAADPSPLKPMETLLMYRAVLMACSLAARSDTSKLLTMQNLDQVVQVL